MNSSKQYSKSESPIITTLKYRDFRWLWIGSFGSFLAMNIQMITRSWLALQLTDNNPLLLAMVMASFALPMTVFSLLGGALADRLPRRSLIVFSQSGNAIMTLFIAILDMTGNIELWHLLIIGVLNGSMMAINMPSRQAILSDIVPDKLLMNAIALNTSSMNLTRVIGPAIAGFLIIIIETSGVFLIVSIIYVLTALSMSMVNAGKTPIKISKKSTITSDIKEGILYVINDKTRRNIMLMLFIPVLFGFSYYSLLPAWATEALDAQSDGLGIIMMGMGLGALTGSLIIAYIKKINSKGKALLLACSTWGLLLAIFAQSNSYYMAIPLVIFIGIFSSVFMSLNTTLLQSSSEPDKRGRVMSVSMMSFGLMPLSSIPFGALALITGTSNSLSLSGLILLALTILFFIFNDRLRNL